MGAFDYPLGAASRRHGPLGYADYHLYRPWLRDEFSFRCVYCLRREQWGLVTGEFDIDHFEPQANEPERREDYDNLLYSCHTCNLRKGAAVVPDPWELLTASQVRVRPDGELATDSPDANRIILSLGLNSDAYKEFRIIWMRIVDLAATSDRDLYVRLMGFPEDLPDLSTRRPPGGNSRPDGVDSSWHALRELGELPEVY